MNRRIQVGIALLIAVVALVVGLYIRNSNNQKNSFDTKTVTANEGIAMIKDCQVKEVDYGISPTAVSIQLQDDTNMTVSPINEDELDEIGDAILATKSNCPTATFTN